MRDVGAGAVGTIERRRQIFEELRSIGENTCADLVEHLDRQTAGIRRCFQHGRRNGTDQHGLGHAGGAVPTDIARHFAAAGGVSNMDGIPKVQLPVSPRSNSRG
jgi:hypothetical protein